MIGLNGPSTFVSQQQIVPSKLRSHLIAEYALNDNILTANNIITFFIFTTPLIKLGNSDTMSAIPLLQYAKPIKE